MMDNPLDMCNFFIVIAILNYAFSFIELVTIIKNINFEYIILASRKFLV